MSATYNFEDSAEMLKSLDVILGNDPVIRVRRAKFLIGALQATVSQEDKIKCGACDQMSNRMDLITHGGICGSCWNKAVVQRMHK